MSPLAVGEDTVVWSRMSPSAGWLRGHCSLGKNVGCTSTCYSDGRGLDPWVWQNILLWRLVMK